jgi:tRNA-splicing ligase RtcB
MARESNIQIEQLDANRWRIPKQSRPDMRVDGIIYSDDKLIAHVLSDKAAEQVANVATLPGIVGASLAMPDIHWGYGFCIGGVAATDVADGGVISPGGVGYDINCGVRLLTTNLAGEDVRGGIGDLVNQLFRDVPAGVGVGGPFKFTTDELRKICTGGAKRLAEVGLAEADDIEATEAGGCVEGADPDAVSPTALKRGLNQCGTLGAGNHFVEVQVVDEIFDAPAAEAMGLVVGQATIMIHSGSRGFGFQVCDDAIKALRSVPEKLGIVLPDRQLVCAPVKSPHGQRYLGAMRSAANYAWANRQLLARLARKALAHHMRASEKSLEIRQVYDVAHNIAKIETHEVGGQERTLCVHRKGATRAFGPGHPELPPRYRHVGQPVLIPGSMGTASYVLVGTEKAMSDTFGSTCHGAGRMMSRKAAIRSAAGRQIAKELAAVGVIARARGRTGLAEEQPDAYKDVHEVVDVVHNVGISRKVARLKPMGVIKG